PSRIRGQGTARHAALCDWHVFAVVLQGDPLDMRVYYPVQHARHPAQALGRVQITRLVAVQDELVAIDLDPTHVEAGIGAQLPAYGAPCVAGEKRIALLR